MKPRALALALFCGALVFAALAQAPTNCPPQWQGARPPESQLTLCWRLQNNILRARMSHPGNVWLALGFGESMAGSDAIVGRPDTGEVLDVSIAGYDAAAVVADKKQNLTGPRFARFDGKRTVVEFARPLKTHDDKDAVLLAQEKAPIIWAAGKAPGFAGHFARGAMLIHWGEGAAFAWSANAIWHAVLMSVAFGLAMPLGAAVARYCKVLKTQDFPRELDNQFWWHWHLALQYGGALLAAVGLFLVWNANKPAAASPHSLAGYVALALAALQVVGGLLRGSKGGPVDDNGRPNPPEKIRGDHYDMTLRRRVFEATHKFFGYAALAAGALAIALGAALAQTHWLALGAFALLLCVLVAHVVYLRQSGRRVATYHAIWGMDASHPGNRAGFLGGQNKGAKNEN